MKLGQRVALNSSFEAARQIFVVFSGIVSVGITTRYLSVDQYGGVLAALVLVSLLSVATDFGIKAMTVRAMARDPENEVAIASSAFWVWIAFTVPTALVILIGSWIFYPGADGETTRQSVLILMATFPLAPLAGVAAARAMADQRVWVTSLSSIVARSCALGAVILAAVLDGGPLGIAAAFAAGFVFEQAFAILFVRPRVELRTGLNRARIWSLVAAAVPLGVVMVINGLYFRLDAFLLSLLGSQSDLAFYGVAYKAFDSLLVLPGFVMVTLVPVLAKLEFSDERFQELVQKAFTSMTILAAPIVGFSLLGREAMIALAGPRYAEGGLVLTLIMCSVALACLQGVFGYALVTQGRQKLLLKVSLAVLVANGLLNLVAIPLYGDRGAAAALLFTECLSLVLTLRVYRGLAPAPSLESPWRLLAAVTGLVVVAAACTGIPRATVAIVVGVPLGLCAYVAALIALHALPPYMRDPFESVMRAIGPKLRSIRPRGVA
jgi:O-antigen/teichoic acid export membrane protein